MASPGTPVAIASGSGTITGIAYSFAVGTPSPAGASVIVATGGTAVATNSVTDSQSNVYSLLAAETGSAQKVQVYAAGSASALNATDTITVTKQGTVSAAIENYIASYVTGAYAGDLGAQASGSGTVYSVSATPVTGNEIALAYVANAAAGLSPGTPAGFTQIGQAHGGPWLTGWQAPVTQITPLTATGTLTSAAWGAALVSLEAIPVLAPAAPTMPHFPAGWGPQQADFTGWWTNPAAFFQNRMVLRARQSGTTTTIPSSGGTVTIAFDTIDEDPWGGWNASTHTWTPPSGYSGWFQATLTVFVQAPGATGVVLTPQVNAALGTGDLANILLPNAPGGAEGSCLIYLTGGQDGAKGQAWISNASSNVTTSNTYGQQSSLELMWISS